MVQPWPLWIALILAAVGTCLSQSHVYREGTELKLDGQRWTGSGMNVYWLGLDENVIPPPGQPFYAPKNASYPTKERVTETMNTLNVLGAKAIRCQTLGVSVGNPLSLEPELGVWNEQAFEAMDWAVYQAGTHGLKIMAPLTDNYDYFHGGKFVFLRWHGYNLTEGDSKVMEFYNNRTIVDSLKAYIKKLITHKNPYTNLTYADDPTIFAYETGNELGGPFFLDENVPNNWTQEIASYIKELAPKKLVVDGTYGVNKTHFAVKEIDIFSNHYYPPNVARLTNDITAVAGTNRTYIAGEYNWTITNANGGGGADSLANFYALIESHQTGPQQVVIGDMPWSLFGKSPPNCSDSDFVRHTGDGVSLYYNDPMNSDNITKQIITIRKHFWKMQGKDVGDDLPAVGCPGPLTSGSGSLLPATSIFGVLGVLVWLIS